MQIINSVITNTPNKSWKAFREERILLTSPKDVTIFKGNTKKHGEKPKNPMR